MPSSNTNNSITLKILKLDKQLPTIKPMRKGDAGLDLYASENMALNPMETKLIKTGIAVAIPDGFVGLIKDRSGLALKNSLHCLAGVIDSNYRGEIGVVIINLGQEKFEVKRKMRIAQLLIVNIAETKIEVVESLDQTSRNEAGFGSSGV